MSDMPEDIRNLFYTFGVTAQKAQLMETAAGNAILAYMTLFVDTNNITPEVTQWAKQVMDDMNTRTFGALLKVIKKSIKIDEATTEIMNDALKTRNYVTHHFFIHHNFALHREEGRKLMIDDLNACAVKFERASTIFDGLWSCLQQFAGRSADFGAEDHARLAERGKRIKL